MAVVFSPCLGESRSLGLERKSGGRFHPRLNISTSPIDQKYREGKVKRTLKRGLIVLEIVKGEANISVELGCI